MLTVADLYGGVQFTRDMVLAWKKERSHFEKVDSSCVTARMKT